MLSCAKCMKFLYPDELENLYNGYYYCEACYPIVQITKFDPNDYNGLYIDPEDGTVHYY